jgi:nitrite reductase/ring-hydroxylating ferredoxin subunit
MDETYIKVAEFRLLREGQGLAVRAEGIEIALFRIGDAVHAIENLCPHQHVPVLAEGLMEGNILTCPMHGWRFDVISGACVHASGQLKKFLVKVDAGDVFIAFPDLEAPPWW